MSNKTQHALPAVAGTPTRCAARRPCAMRYVTLGSETMKYLLLIILFLAQSSYSQVDVYQWCQANMESIKNLSTLPTETLVRIKGNIAKADSVEELSIVLANDFNPMIAVAQNHQNISEEEARKVVLSTLKSTEINRFNLAISMQGVIDELKWNEVFDKCVLSNRGSL